MFIAYMPTFSIPCIVSIYWGKMLENYIYIYIYTYVDIVLKFVTFVTSLTVAIYCTLVYYKIK